MCAEFALGETDGFDKSFKGVELERCQAEAGTDALDKFSLFRRAGRGIFLELDIGISLYLLYDTTGNQLKVTLRGSETDEGTAVVDSEEGTYVILFRKSHPFLYQLLLFRGQKYIL